MVKVILVESLLIFNVRRFFWNIFYAILFLTFNHHVEISKQKGLGFFEKGTSTVIDTISEGNFRLIFTNMIHFQHRINFMGIISTFWRVILFGWKKAVEKMLHEKKTSREVTVITAYENKYNVKVGWFVVV